MKPISWREGGWGLSTYMKLFRTCIDIGCFEQQVFTEEVWYLMRLLFKLA